MAHEDKDGAGRTTRRWDYSSGSQSVVCKSKRAMMPGLEGGVYEIVIVFLL